jgi:enoyl-[acyl-carrier-protein] reductase (NADH)|tara:strand:- start:1862 stop:2113 length:252 start_codon:yes stop_codon:yes gene_type:complete
MEKKVLSEEEINKLKDLKSRFKQLTDVVGETEVQIMNLEFTKNNLKQQFINIQQEEVKLAKELEEKYGKGSISLDSGEFLPSN